MRPPSVRRNAHQRSEFEMRRKKTKKTNIGVGSGAALTAAPAGQGDGRQLGVTPFSASLQTFREKAVSD